MRPPMPSSPPPRRVDAPLAVAALVLACAIGLTTASALAITGITVDGPGVLDADSKRPLLATWQQTTVEVTVEPDREAHRICLRANSSTTGAWLACQNASGDAARQTVSFSITGWPRNLTGPATLVAVATPPNGTTPIARAERRVDLLHPDGDRDDDGLANRVELDVGSGLRRPDTDGDGLLDGKEYNVYGTNVTAADTDGDGLTDGAEVNRYGTDPTAADTDNDGLEDGAEVTSYGTNPLASDTDGDGLDDGAEVGRHHTDPTVADTDDDSLADGPEINVHGTDPRRADTDGDGLDDGAEVKRYRTDPTAADTDDDGFNDGAEVNRYGTDPTRANADPEIGAGASDPRQPTTGQSLDSYVPGPIVSETPASVVAGVLAATFLSAVVAIVTLSARDVGGHATEADEPPSDTVSDSERIQRLLADHGGRLPQSEIVERTDWSKSKVSRVLSAMAEADQVRKIRIGRENIVARPGDEPEHAGSPYRDGE